MSKKQNEQSASARGIMEKLDKILLTTYETLKLLKSIEKESEA